MTEPAAPTERVQDKAWRAVLDVLTTAASRVDPEGLKDLAESYELLMQHA
jgi:hypothetical protein